MFLRPPAPTVTIARVYNITESDRTIEVNITVTDVSDLFAWAINMSWDPNIIKLTTGDPHGLKKGGIHYNIYEGPFLKSIRSSVFIANVIDNKQGKITFLSAGYLESGQTPSGTGVLATINFTCVNVGTTTIEINGPSPGYPGHSILQDGRGKEIYHEDIDGLVTEQGPPPIWMELWLQVTIIAIVIVIVAVASYVTLRKKLVQNPPKGEKNPEACVLFYSLLSFIKARLK